MNSKEGCLSRLRSKTTQKLELCFFQYGVIVSRHPLLFILASLLLTSVCSIGMLNFYHEKNPMKLWIPPDSDFKKDTELFMSGFGEGYRIQSVMITASDVLQPHIMQRLIQIRNQVSASVLQNVSWEDVCFRVPVVQLNRRKKRDANNDLFEEEEESNGESSVFSFEPTVHLTTPMFCKIVSSFSTGCYEHSLLEFWSYDESEIQTLTKEMIISELNHTTNSPVLGLKMDYNHLLGGVVRNESGIIVSATALLSLWMVHVNFSAVNMDEAGNDGGTADWANNQGLIWEESFLKTMHNVSLSFNASDGTEIFYESSRSFGDISSAAMFQDISKIACGVILTFIFVLLVLSKWSCLEIRVIPAAAGMMCVGLAFISACGLCSALGISYGPIHTSLPFLLMGIGVDDMFVIASCRNHLSETQKRKNLPEQMGTALRHAGVSITVTSFTDIVASTIGGTTILPALESFCFYAAAGVFFTFIYQATFFVSIFVLDEQRVLKKRNPFLPCVIHESSVSRNNKKTLSSPFIHFLFSKLLLKTPMKDPGTAAVWVFSPGKVPILRHGEGNGFVWVIILIGTCCFAGVSVKGVLSLKQEYDPKWFLPSDSYLVQYLNARDKWYSDSGQEAIVLLGQLNYTLELRNIHKLVKELKKQNDIVKDVDTWYDAFRKYANQHFNKSIPYEDLLENDFRIIIGKFLYSPNGGKYQKNFRFNGKLECGEQAPLIRISTLDFKFRLFNGSQEAVSAMNRIKDLVRMSNINSGDGYKSVWSKAFATWTTDEVIHHELFRNLVLSVICVMATTTALILNISACFWIFICVLLTLLDICGMMFYWGMTVDIVSCIALVLGVGLCIDYAAHVGQTFLHCHGSRQQRALKTVDSIGTAVLMGGFSTLLAMSMLFLSSAYIFQAFFKIFFLVVTIGLFHGVLFLPVVLSCIGPEPHTILIEHDLKLTDEGDNSSYKSEEIECLNIDENVTRVNMK